MTVDSKRQKRPEALAFDARTEVPGHMLKRAVAAMGINLLSYDRRSANGQVSELFNAFLGNLRS